MTTWFNNKVKAYSPESDKGKRPLKKKTLNPRVSDAVGAVFVPDGVS